MIDVRSLSKTFRIQRKAPGLRGSLVSVVRRRYEPRHAVREVSFRVGEGEIVGLVGSNGAGKTTLVKMLAGIVHPSGGDATVLGFRPWERDDRLRRQIALIMGQKAQLWWDLPAGDSFLLLREIYRVEPRRHREALAYLADLLGVSGLLDVQLRRLSLGERMKMELIAALLHEPRVVFLDEPTIGLDLTAQRAIRDFILRYREERQPAMLVTSHYMDDIEELCPRILILREGELVYDGPLRQVVERWARHKVVTATLREPMAPAVARELATLGRVLAGDGEGDAAGKAPAERLELRLEVPREGVAEAAAAILGRAAVADLTIEEEPLATIVEGILRAREGNPADGRPAEPPPSNRERAEVVP